MLDYIPPCSPHFFLCAQDLNSNTFPRIFFARVKRSKPCAAHPAEQVLLCSTSHAGRGAVSGLSCTKKAAPALQTDTAERNRAAACSSCSPERPKKQSQCRRSERRTGFPAGIRAAPKMVRRIRHTLLSEDSRKSGILFSSGSGLMLQRCGRNVKTDLCKTDRAW